MNERPSQPSPLVKPEFPQSGRIDPDWMMDNQMGPNALWLMEWLCEALELAARHARPGPGLRQGHDQHLLGSRIRRAGLRRRTSG
ncbi:MAG: hypothetical protein MZV63_66455 [Marinilabiliales bacterium]|nr:hypothetical protein [Marinilabiliales bacterium]